jgi:Short C-terminal domain
MTTPWVECGVPPLFPVDVTSQLTRLADLKAQGVLTDTEFEAQKAKVLAAG